MLHFDDTRIFYEPYPVCEISQALDPGLYKALIESYPPVDLFAEQPDVGRKYVLSEKCNGHAYHRFLSRCRVWSEFHDS